MRESQKFQACIRIHQSSYRPEGVEAFSGDGDVRNWVTSGIANVYLTLWPLTHLPYLCAFITSVSEFPFAISENRRPGAFDRPWMLNGIAYSTGWLRPLHKICSILDFFSRLSTRPFHKMTIPSTKYPVIRSIYIMAFMKEMSCIRRGCPHRNHSP